MPNHMVLLLTARSKEDCLVDSIFRDQYHVCSAHGLGLFLQDLWISLVHKMRTVSSKATRQLH